MVLSFNVCGLLTVPLFIEGQRGMSVACDDGNFSSPKSSQEGVAFPFGRRTCFQTKCGAEILRATLVTPPPFGHPLYEQRGSWLLHRLTRYSFQGEAASDVRFELYLGAEHDLVSLDEAGRREIRGGHDIARVALAAEAYLQATEVLQHYGLTGKEGTRHGGTVVDVTGQILEGVVTGLHYTAMEVLGTFNGVLTWVLGLSYCIGDWHKKQNWKPLPPPSPEGRELSVIAGERKPG